MPRMKDDESSLHVAIASGVMKAIKKLAGENGRPLKDEVEHALRRHLASPPQIVRTEETPPLPPAAEAVRPRRKPGRKPGKPPGSA